MLASNTGGVLEQWWPGDWGLVARTLLDTLVCLGTAFACGLVVGWERERSDKPAGLRTHTLVALGAAGFVHLGVVAHAVGDLGTLSDFNRLVQSVAVGIGFLGAGTIFRRGAGVKGLTTAASIWITGAIGAAAGAGAIGLAVLLTLCGYAVLRWLHFLERKREE